MELTEWVNGVFVILTDFLVFDHKEKDIRIQDFIITLVV